VWKEISMNAQTKVEADPRSKLEVALAEALPKLEGAKKNSANPHFKSKYADLGAVIDAIRPIAEHGIWFRQVLHEGERGVTVETLYTGHGATITAGTLFMPAGKQDAQGFGSALTYARRYALQTAFGLATEDDDGNAGSRQPANDKSHLHQQLEQSVEQGKKEPAHSKLKTELRGFVRELEGIGDWDEYCAFRDTAEFQRLTKDCREKLPHWWDGWDEQPDGFVPLHRRIELLESNLAQNIADLARA
jgi:hypothetical protein